MAKAAASPTCPHSIYNFLVRGSRTLWKPSRLERAVVKLTLRLPPHRAACASGPASRGSSANISRSSQLRLGAQVRGPDLGRGPGLRCALEWQPSALACVPVGLSVRVSMCPCVCSQGRTESGGRQTYTRYQTLELEKGVLLQPLPDAAPPHRDLPRALPSPSARSRSVPEPPHEVEERAYKEEGPAASGAP